MQWLAFFVDIRERHFRTGEPPAPPQPALPALAHQPNLPSRDWYAGPYLAELPSIGNAPEFTPELRRLIATHLVTEGGEGIARNARGLTLLLLTRARSWPPLAGVARAIPPRWRTRVKSWLL
jgi:hypothetical protein